MEMDLIGPKTTNTPYFTLTSSLLPEDLVKASTILLSAVRKWPKLTRAFRLEVTFLTNGSLLEATQNTARFRICLDPVLWYDIFLSGNPKFEETVKFAREYITTTRMQALPEEDGPFVVNHDENEKNNAYIMCREPPSRSHNKSRCNFDHPQFICKGIVTTRDGRKTSCDYYFATKLIIPELSTDDYIISLRREPIRELLLLPRPRKDIDNYNHYDNEMLIQHTDFWKRLIEQRQRLNFHSMAVNFGQWETGRSRDKYAQACHAHVHLLFDRETWEAVKGMVSDNESLLSKLNARNYPGPNYLLKDCLELEQQRLQFAEHQCMLSIQQSILTTQQSLLTTQQSILSTQQSILSTQQTVINSMQVMTNGIQSMEQSMRVMTNGIQSMGQGIQSVEQSMINGFTKLSETVENGNKSLGNSIDSLTTAICSLIKKVEDRI